MSETMRAMIWQQPGEPLQLQELPIPRPGDDEVLVEVSACGLCATDTRLAPDNAEGLPRIPGHQIVGRVVDAGDAVDIFAEGDRVGVSGPARSCGHCAACRADQQPYCAELRRTGEQVDGGFAHFMLVDHRFAFLVPPTFADIEMAPLLCPLLRAYSALEQATAAGARRIGVYGGGYAAQVLVELMHKRGLEVYACLAGDDFEGQTMARQLGAEWAGGQPDAPPQRLDAGLVLASEAAWVAQARTHLGPAGNVFCTSCSPSWAPGSQRVADPPRSQIRSLFTELAGVRVRSKPRTYGLPEADAALAALPFAGSSEPLVLCVAGR